MTDTKNNTNNRVLGRVLARELSPEELTTVSGARAIAQGADYETMVTTAYAIGGYSMDGHVTDHSWHWA